MIRNDIAGKHRVQSQGIHRRSAVQNLIALFNFRDAPLYFMELLGGAWISVQLTIYVMALSLVLGLVIALMRISPNGFFRRISTIYVEIIRGTPALLQLFYIYFVLPAFGLRLPAFLAGVIGLTVNYAAYLSEVYRAGIQAVAHGQNEAAQSLGLSRWLTMRHIILPQALRIVVPPLGNYFISLFKDTSLVSTITVKELIFTGQIIAATNFQYFTIFTIIGVIYLAISYVGSLMVQYLEHWSRIETGARRPGAAQGAN
ncbi:MAG: ectoine/hydroxyectoine ABC transporter permease subunit EhuD [Proteobacteria bacterium]|nr:ectoine/hydroxyectoine ABC transporter permease subunit EhuD [Pseudomonadota bacterium]MBI3498820.1 ectoine/hydroxyectoine ABC transporter permease subunit EhuD [Pseudomonadota bacterium]